MTEHALSVGIIVNPISGTLRDKSVVVQTAERFFSAFPYEVFTTQKSLDAVEKAQEWVASGKHLIAVIGGDGTLNEVAQVLAGTDVHLFPIPMGSGNGFARHFGIKSWKTMFKKPFNSMSLKRIGLASINENTFLNVAGIGADARLAKLFQSSEKRGFRSYIWITLKALFSLSSYATFQMNLYPGDWWCVVCANGSQYGNDFYIDPDASPESNTLTFLFVPLPKLKEIWQVCKAFVKRDLSQFPRVLKRIEPQMQFSANRPLRAHVDGEPLEKTESFEIKMLPVPIKIWLP